MGTFRSWTTSASSTTAWARSACPRTRCGGRRPSGRWRTSRSAAPRWRTSTCVRWRWSRPPPPRSTPTSACSVPRWPTRSGPPRPRSSRAITTDQFPVDVFQTGSGTSSNMNMNEVLATLATRSGVERPPQRPRQREPVEQRRLPHLDPRRRVRAATEQLLPAWRVLATSLEAKAEEFADTVKSGRTHLMDATPVMLGQELGGYAAIGPAGGSTGSRSTLPRVAELPLGGTAVGTGINTPPGFAAAVIAELAESTGLPFTEAEDHFEAQGGPRRARRALRPAATLSPWGSPRSATTCAGCPPARGPASPRSTCPTSSRARASCRARSTRSCPRRR